MPNIELCAFVAGAKSPPAGAVEAGVLLPPNIPPPVEAGAPPPKSPPPDFGCSVVGVEAPLGTVVCANLNPLPVPAPCAPKILDVPGAPLEGVLPNIPDPEDTGAAVLLPKSDGAADFVVVAAPPNIEPAPGGGAVVAAAPKIEFEPGCVAAEGVEGEYNPALSFFPAPVATACGRPKRVGFWFWFAPVLPKRLPVVLLPAAAAGWPKLNLGASPDMVAFVCTVVSRFLPSDAAVTSLSLSPLARAAAR